jgi:hypothetical protein
MIGMNELYHYVWILYNNTIPLKLNITSEINLRKYVKFVNWLWVIWYIFRTQRFNSRCIFCELLLQLCLIWFLFSNLLINRVYIWEWYKHWESNTSSAFDLTWTILLMIICQANFNNFWFHKCKLKWFIICRQKQKDCFHQKAWLHFRYSYVL